MSHPVQNLVNHDLEENKDINDSEQEDALDSASEEIGDTINPNNIDGKNWPPWLDKHYNWTKISQKEKIAYALRIERGTLDDHSSHNTSVYKFQWTELADKALMYAQQAHGICQVKAIKKAFKMFEGIPESVINARCHHLLGCTFVGNINKIKCDPFKVKAFYEKMKAELLSTHNPLPKGLIKNGKVINSMPPTERDINEEFIFFSRNFAADPYMSDIAKDLLRRTGLLDLQFPKLIYFKGNDVRVNKNFVEMHEIQQNTLAKMNKLSAAELLVKVKLDYYTSSVAAKLDKELTAKRARHAHTKNIQEIFETALAQEAATPQPGTEKITKRKRRSKSQEERTTEKPKKRLLKQKDLVKSRRQKLRKMKVKQSLWESIPKRLPQAQMTLNLTGVVMWGENESKSDSDEASMLLDESLNQHFCVIKTWSQKNFKKKTELEYESDDIRNHETE